MLTQISFLQVHTSFNDLSLQLSNFISFKNRPLNFSLSLTCYCNHQWVIPCRANGCTISQPPAPEQLLGTPVKGFAFPVKRVDTSKVKRTQQKCGCCGIDLGKSIIVVGDEPMGLRHV